MKWLRAVVRPVCYVTTAMVWIVIHMAALHYTMTILGSHPPTGTFVPTVLVIAFPISAFTGASYLLYRWVKGIKAE